MCDLSTAESGAGPIASASNSVVQMAGVVTCPFPTCRRSLVVA